MLARFIDNPREDSLTAAVFSHLLHLPIEDILGNPALGLSYPRAPSARRGTTFGCRMAAVERIWH